MKKPTVDSLQLTAPEKRKDNAETQRSAERRKSPVRLVEFALLGLVPQGF
jgi:hypothetical protein